MSMLVNQLELLNKDGCQSDHDMYQANSNGIQCGIVQQSHSKVNDAIQSTYMYEQQPTYIYHLNTQNTPLPLQLRRQLSQSPKTTRTKEPERKAQLIDSAKHTKANLPARPKVQLRALQTNRHSLNIPTIAKNETRTKNSKRRKRKENTYFEKRKSDPFICH